MDTETRQKRIGLLGMMAGIGLFFFFGFRYAWCDGCQARPTHWFESLVFPTTLLFTSGAAGYALDGWRGALLFGKGFVFILTAAIGVGLMGYYGKLLLL